MTDLTIGGETFNVLIEGNEMLPVLMLSNSLGSNLHMWDGQMPDLLKHFRVVRYDSRGHGGSVANDGPYSIDILGQDALAILDALGIEKVSWMGLSKGGAVGQWLMIKAPERIERAVLANTAARFGSPDTWNQRIAVVRRDGMAPLANSILKRWFSDDFVESDAVVPVREALLDTPALGYAACCAALRDLDLREGLYTIEHPVLVIAGDDDLSVLKPQTDLLAKTIPGARLVTLRARHISNVEDRAAFTKAAIDFLTATSPARRAPHRKPSVPLSSARRPAGRRLIPARGAVVEPHSRRAGGTPVSAKAPAPVAGIKPGRAASKSVSAIAPKPAKAPAKIVAAKAPAKPKAAAKKAAPVVGKSAKPKAKAAAPKKAIKAASAPVAAKVKTAPGKMKAALAKPISKSKATAPKTHKASPAKTTVPQRKLGKATATPARKPVAKPIASQIPRAAAKVKPKAAPAKKAKTLKAKAAPKASKAAPRSTKSKKA